jgi:hypothetical protein
LDTIFDEVEIFLIDQRDLHYGEKTYLADFFIVETQFLANDIERPVAVNKWDLNGNGMRATTSMNQTTLSFSKSAAVETRKEIFEQEWLTQQGDIFVTDFVDQNIEKLHVGEE